MSQVTFALRLPIALVSEANHAGHAHWSVRQRRAKAQRMGAQIVAMEAGRALRQHAAVDPQRKRVAPGWRLEVRIVRHGVRSLDSDNLAGAGKHVRDGVADALGINDRDPSCLWHVEEGARVQKGIQAWCEVHIVAKRTGNHGG